MRFQISAAWMLAVLVASPARLHSYIREDHYASVRLVLNASRPELEGEVLVGLCSQLPDEAPEISAIDVYRRLMTHPVDYTRWTLRSDGPTRTVGRMVTIHQLLHGLTGGHPDGVQQVAKNVVLDTMAQLQSIPKGSEQKRTDTLCALGFALHLYGDSFSHEMIKNPDKMYREGIGHLFDASRPDHPLYSRKRLELWKGYLSTLQELIPHSEADDMKDLFQKIEDSQRLASSRNGYNLIELRKHIARQLNRVIRTRPMTPFDRSSKQRGCQAIMDRQAMINGITPPPRCDATWTIFRDFAIKEYDLYDQQHPNQPSRHRTRAHYFMESPFADGPKW